MRNEISSFVIADPTKCVGCRTCELACFTVHNSKNETNSQVGCDILLVDLRSIPCFMNLIFSSLLSHQAIP